MSPPLCRIATRRSPLAVRQAELVADALNREAGVRTELLRVQTEGDQMLDHPLAAIGGKGLFVKELENRLLSGDADLAVHSMKDVPADLPSGLTLAAICTRADPRDGVIAPHHKTIEALPAGSRVGTSSLRRKAQLQARFPDLQFSDLRGNVGTRLKRVQEGDFDAIVLACAGLQRLGLDEHITQILEPEVCLPAIGQGALGIEMAEDHPHAQAWVGALHDPDTAAAVTAERMVSRALSGSCQVPLAAHAVCTGDQEVQVQACLARPDGSLILRAASEGESRIAGAMAAKQLLEQGGADILAELGVAGYT